MITLALLLATQSVLDAERAFAQLAQDKGQWTAFRATAAPDAVMFVPDKVNAQEWLKDRKDPPKSVKWWPTDSWESCDGSLAVTHGGALWPNGAYGWFTTVWKRQSNGTWRWVLDHGELTAQARPPGTQPMTLRPTGCLKLIEYPVPPAGAKPGYSATLFESNDRTMKVAAYTYPGGRSLTVTFGPDPAFRPPAVVTPENYYRSQPSNREVHQDRVAAPK